jgi:hypothetical protein
MGAANRIPPSPGSLGAPPNSPIAMTKDPLSTAATQQNGGPA